MSFITFRFHRQFFLFMYFILNSPTLNSKFLFELIEETKSVSALTLRCTHYVSHASVSHPRSLQGLIIEAKYLW